MEFQHQLLAEGRWFTLSLTEQLANIGSEVHRAIRARGNENRYNGAIKRGFELFTLTLNDARWCKRRKELTRVKELFCDAILGGAEYGTSLEDLDKYFNYFALAARNDRYTQTT